MLRRDRASAALGMVVERDEPGEAVVSMRVREDMTNGFAITHGGMVFALADTAFAMACNEIDPLAAGAGDDVTVAAGADISFVKATRAGQILTAHARRRILSGRSGLYDVTVTDETGDVVAEFRGRSFTTRRTHPDDAVGGGAEASVTG
ncbi:hydroxyphenylacetyl-CoA thioesterase PaaI [Microbacterium trichothecenolyticum]|uniref:hydroxyphenylacetyl-CoA thioesterase PaaI n=1 Tax=Microbacterium trichothecenolyticum TaxID=69370 RepID=UPI001C6F3CB8|nr:hydroxyphenylacetyl-CoA thioesterase PaaI [Microbacterium trichothecenolyticum]MBW9121540.1 hydroxyphenylacetyl-CoA thioesterase PaaI [Microbacterium trichothecenolyticum]